MMMIPMRSEGRAINGTWRLVSVKIGKGLYTTLKELCIHMGFLDAPSHEDRFTS